MKSKTTNPVPYAEPHTIHLAAIDAPTLDVAVQFVDQASRVFAPIVINTVLEPQEWTGSAVKSTTPRGSSLE